MGWCWLVQSHRISSCIKKPPTPPGALRVSRQQPQSVVLGGGLSSRNKPTFPLFLPLKELQLNWMQSFSPSLPLQGVSSWKTEQVLYLEAGIFQGLAVRELQGSASPLPLCSVWSRHWACSAPQTAQSLSPWMGAGNFTACKKCETSSPGDAQDGGEELLAEESSGASQLSQNPFNGLNYPGISMNYLISSGNSSRPHLILPLLNSLSLGCRESPHYGGKNAGYHINTTELLFHSLKCHCWSQFTTKLCNHSSTVTHLLLFFFFLCVLQKVDFLSLFFQKALRPPVFDVWTQLSSDWVNKNLIFQSFFGG